MKPIIFKAGGQVEDWMHRSEMADPVKTYM